MRRVIAILVAAIPFAVVVFCLVSPDRAPELLAAVTDWPVPEAVTTVVGWVLLGTGALICVNNVYLSWIGPGIHLLRGKPLEEYRGASGIPIFGTLFIMVGLVLVPCSLMVTLAVLVLIAADTGGWHWFVIWTWRDDSFWQPGAS